MARAQILLADGFEEIEALGTIDILRRGGVEVVSTSIGSSCEVRGAHGINVKADALLADVENEDFDVVILPGGGEGTDNLRASAKVFELLRRQKAQSRLIAAICAAPVILCEAGVLDPGQHVTCYPTCVMDLDRQAAGVPVVADGDVITGQAPGATILFALVLLKSLVGEAAAKKVARGLVTNVFD